MLGILEGDDRKHSAGWLRARTLPLALLAAACSVAPLPGPVHGEEVLTVRGQVENGPFRFGRDDLALLRARAVHGRLPDGRTATFTGPSLAALLAEGMQVGQGVDTAVVHSRDGYAVAVPLPLVKQLQPVLADRADGRPLAEWSGPAGKGLPPLLLAWPNLSSPGLDSDPRARTWWPADVDAIELVGWRQTYGKALRPPAGVADDVRAGAEAYGLHCIACHRLRGTGGTRGPELTHAAAGLEPAGMAERFRAHALAMGGPAARAPEGREPFRSIASFLLAVDRAGNPPPAETPADDLGSSSGAASGDGGY